MQLRTAFLILLLVACPMVCFAGIGLMYETSFSLPDLGGNIVKTAFTGASGDIGYQVAVASNHRIIVYDYKNRAVLRTVDYQAKQLVGLVYADVTHDQTPDLVYSYLTSDPKPRFVVIGINGATGKADTLKFRGYDGGACAAQGGVIGAFDLNKDGSKELFISADSGISRNSTETTFGRSRLYYSFPDSLLWNHLMPRVQSATYVPCALKDPGLYLQLQSCYSSPSANLGPEPATSGRYLLPDGQSADLNIPLPSPCGSQPINNMLYDTRALAVRTTGEYGAVTELFTITDRVYTCGTNTDTTSARWMASYLIHSPSAVELSWSSQITANYVDAVTDTRFTPFLFMFEADHRAVTILRISDGAFRSQIRQVPAGQKHWDYPTSDGVPRLVVANGQEISLYHLSATSDDPDDGNNDQLPVSFAIGQTYPYPDQFGVVIPVDVPRSGRLTVEVFDHRGKRVRLLADQPMTPGRTELRWDASDAGSGFFEIRATLGNRTEKRKVLLWR